uniref:Uncharacterized protein n=1 Tax=Arundo donax TaxID=35708 RepID=A0A0A9ASJ5_ARUDO
MDNSRVWHIDQSATIRFRHKRSINNICEITRPDEITNKKKRGKGDQ